MSRFEAWEPSENDTELALQGGMTYVAAVAILHDPVDTVSFHRMDPENEKIQIVDEAVHMIAQGIGRIIRYSNPPEIRHSLARMRPRFKQPYHISRYAN